MFVFVLAFVASAPEIMYAFCFTADTTFCLTLLLKASRTRKARGKARPDESNVRAPLTPGDRLCIYLSLRAVFHFQYVLPDY